MIQFLAISKNTFFQTIRQPIFAVLICLTLLVLLIGFTLSAWTMNPEGEYQKDDQIMLQTMGLTTLLVSGVFIAAFSAANVVSREIEDRTALTVISKPVSRATFVLGKYAGVSAAVTMAFYLCALVFLMTVRHGVKSVASSPFDWPVIVLGTSALLLTTVLAGAGNLFFGWSYLTAWIWSAMTLLSLAMGLICFIGKGWTLIPFGQGLPPQLLLAMVLMLMAVLTLVAVALAASTRLGQMMTLLVCFGVLLLATGHASFFGRSIDAASRQANPVLWAVGLIMPNLTYYFSLTPETVIPGSYIALAAGHCALSIAALLALAIALFQKRPLEADAGSTSVPGAANLLAWCGRFAAVVALLAGVRMVIDPANFNLAGLATGGGLLVAAVAGWLLWGCFARGLRWSYWTILALAGGWLLASALPLTVPAAKNLQAGQSPQLLLVQTVLAAAVLLILVFPKTRRHFQPASE